MSSSRDPILRSTTVDAHVVFLHGVRDDFHGFREGFATVSARIASVPDRLGSLATEDGTVDAFAREIRDVWAPARGGMTKEVDELVQRLTEAADRGVDVAQQLRDLESRLAARETQVHDTRAEYDRVALLERVPVLDAFERAVRDPVDDAYQAWHTAVGRRDQILDQLGHLSSDWRTKVGQTLGGESLSPGERPHAYLDGSGVHFTATSLRVTTVTSPGLHVTTGPNPGGLQGSPFNPQPVTNPPLQVPTLPPPTGTPGSSQPPVTSPGTELPNARRSWEQARDAYDRLAPGFVAAGLLYGDTLDATGNRYQCVSWAWFRMRELGYRGPTVPADGWQMAAALGGTEDTVPKPGAVISYITGYFTDANGNRVPYGHVMIVEEVTVGPDGKLQIRVSEMNTGSHADRSPAPDSYVDANGVRHFIPASADEFRSDRVLTQQADGSWVDNKGATHPHVTVFNPDYPPGYGS